ncbi:MAG: M20 metallopeptidase family protein [Sarcina sp.]
MLDFLSEAKLIKEEIIGLRRRIHENPELGFEEYETSKLIMAFLKNEGIKFNILSKTGVVGIIKGDFTKGSKVIAIRADMDALPIVEKTSVKYKSKVNGKMHACGHDAHISILLGAAKILNKHKDKFGGIIKLIFEPAEETLGGSKFMIEEGVLENPKVDMAIGLHVEESLDCGKIMIKSGAINAASNPFEISVYGKGGHGAYPEMTVDPIMITANLIVNMQTIISREISPVESGLITVGEITGGTAPNVIPEKVVIKGIIRTVNNEVREFVVRRVREIAELLVKSMRGCTEVNIEESYPSLINNSRCVKLIEESATSIIGRKNVLEQKYPKLGVESFAYFAKEVDSAFYFLGTRNEEKGIIHPAHSGLFNIDEEAILIGIAIQCQSAFNYLTK